MVRERFLEFKEETGEIRSVILVREDADSAELLFWNGEVRTVPYERVSDCESTDMSKASPSRYVIISNLIGVYGDIEDAKRECTELILKLWHRVFTEDHHEYNGNVFEEQIRRSLYKDMSVGNYKVCIDSGMTDGESIDGEYACVPTVDIELSTEIEPTAEVRNFLVKAKMVGMRDIELLDNNVMMSAVQGGKHLMPVRFGKAMFSSSVYYNEETDRINHRLYCGGLYVQSKEGNQEILADLKEGLKFEGGAE